jgi:hypothetical protein
MMHAAVDDLLKCPYSDPMGHLYLESKIIELIAHKVAQICLPDTTKARPVSNLYPSDMECIRRARDILYQQRPHSHPCPFDIEYRSKGMRGTGMALVPLDLPAVSRGNPLDKLGLRSNPQGALIFDEVRIPEKWMMIADPDKGFETQ